MLPPVLIAQQELTTRYMPVAEEQPEQPALGGQPLVGQPRGLRVAAH